MIERLVHALQLLAASADVQLTRRPDLPTRVDELALDYADALRLVTDCPQLDLAPEQLHALERVDERLERLRGVAHARLRSAEALRTAPQWDAVRRLAATALRELGAPVR